MEEDIFYTPDDKLIKDEPTTPIEEDFGEYKEDFCDNNQFIKNDSIVKVEYPLRKSLSMNDLAAPRETLVNLSVKNTTEHVNSTRPAEYKNKYVSTAERDTLGRCHSSRPLNLRVNPALASRLTVPQSPKLLCKLRSRPLHILSREQKEELELEEIRKFKIKARPIPKVVKEGTNHLPEVQRKPSTVPEPFKLTEPSKKPLPASPKPEVSFKARPAPKHILEKAHVPPKPTAVQATRPITSKFHYKRAHSENELTTSKKHKSEENNGKRFQRTSPLKAVPFSFEQRDELMKKRKEERFQKTIEEEKKQASQFKAQPIPGFIKKHIHNAVPKGASSTASSENKENRVKFEAKPPLVLHKEPFKPVHPPPKLVQSKPFHLASEKRAEERDKFDQMLRQKAEQQEKIMRIKEKKLLEAEEKAKIELRAKMVHKAKPVPLAASNPFIPERSSAVLTVPETPKCVRKK